MGAGQRRGRARRNHCHHHHHHHHAAHHGHVTFVGMFYRRGGGQAHPLQRRLWSGLILIFFGLALLCYGAVTTALNSFYGFSVQGIMFLTFGGVMCILGIINSVKVYQLYQSQGPNQQQGGGVVFQAGSAGNAATTTTTMENRSPVWQQPMGPGVWMTGQSGLAMAPPPSYGEVELGQPPPGYTVGDDPPVYPPGGGQPPYGPQGPGGAPPPTQAWQGGPGPETTSTDGPQFFQVQPPGQPTGQINGPGYNPQGPTSSEPPPPSYDEATKVQQIP